MRGASTKQPQTLLMTQICPSECAYTYGYLNVCTLLTLAFDSVGMTSLLIGDGFLSWYNY